jgi:hypothetical protein
VRDIALLTGYSPAAIADALKPFLDKTGVSGPPPTAGGAAAGAAGERW